jgi:hypothetical protein
MQLNHDLIVRMPEGMPMTASSLPGRSFDRPDRPPAIDHRGRLLPAILTLLILLPVGILVDQLYRSINDSLVIAHAERTGVEYLRALGPVTIALNDAQASAVAGNPVPQQSLAKVLDAVSAVDLRVGGQLRTTERWNSLRSTIERLPGSRNAADRYVAYSEASDLLLALYGVVRANSGLIRDPAADLYNLEDGAAEELPEAVVMAGRLTDLSLLASSRPAAEQAAALVDLGTAQNKLASPVGDLAVDLQRAVDTTTSTRLGDVLLGRLDRFRRAVDALGPATAITDPHRLTVEAPRVNAARTDLEAAASDLYATLMHEMDAQLANRIDDVSGLRLRAVGLAALAALLALTSAGLAVLRRRRGGRAGRAAADIATAGFPEPREQSPFGGAARHGEPVPHGGLLPDDGARHYTPTAAGWQERSGAR